MVVSDFYFGRFSVIPTKNQAPLLIDSHAPETLEIAGEGFEPIAGWDSQILQNFWQCVAAGALERPAPEFLPAVVSTALPSRSFRFPCMRNP